MTSAEIGRTAEMIALNEEINSLPEAYKGYARDVSKIRGFGYDLESVEIVNGKPMLKAIEVKAWNKDGFFHVTQNEISILKSLQNSAWIYLVDTSKEKIVKTIKNPFSFGRVKIVPCEFKAYY